MQEQLEEAREVISVTLNYEYGNHGNLFVMDPLHSTYANHESLSLLWNIMPYFICRTHIPMLLCLRTTRYLLVLLKSFADVFRH